MLTIIKKEGRLVEAYRLGDQGPEERQLLAEKKIRRAEDGTYELFSSESVNGAGEIAETGDYFKIDAHGFPYPNKKAWFEANHTHISGNQYMQKPKPLKAWMDGMPVCEEITWLLEGGRLTINETDTQRYFQAFLYGAPLSAARDAVLVFYEVNRDKTGTIQEIDFCFVARDIFEQVYRICE